VSENDCQNAKQNEGPTDNVERNVTYNSPALFQASANKLNIFSAGNHSLAEFDPLSSICETLFLGKAK